MNLVRPEESTSKTETWEEHLLRPLNDWRDGAFDSNNLILSVDPSDTVNNSLSTRVCARIECGLSVDLLGDLCPSDKLALKESDLTRDEFINTPKPEAAHKPDCLVAACENPRRAHRLCGRHRERWVDAGRPDVEKWALTQTKPVVQVGPCVNPRCTGKGDHGGLCQACYQRRRKSHKSGGDASLEGFLRGDRRCVVADCSNHLGTASLCTDHWFLCQSWNRRHGSENLSIDSQIDAWLEKAAVPLVLSKERGIAFGLLEMPLAAELAWAVYKRDTETTHKLQPGKVQQLINRLREDGVTTIVGVEAVAMQKHNASLMNEFVRRVNLEYSAWSGVTTSSSNDVIYSNTLTITDNVKVIGTQSKFDLKPIKQEWLKAALADWLRTTPHSSKLQEARAALRIAIVASDVIGQTPAGDLSALHMARIVAAARKRWSVKNTQRLHLVALDVVMRHGRKKIKGVWDKIPEEFNRNPEDNADHQAAGTAPRPRRGDSAWGDEPFRYVPPPVLNHCVDHLHLLHIKQDWRNYQHLPENYLTLQSRVLIAMAYITGRRPGEIVQLDSDPVGYDSAGDPYLIWYRIKNGRGTTGMRVLGKRIPLSPEAVQVIRDWQEFQLANDITSPWMFPDTLRVRSKKHIRATAVNDATHALTECIPPYENPVEGASGAMLNFDLTTIDAYCFRHGFAQRHADAVDEHGHRLFEPHVLVELMDHRSPLTTAGYYEITARDLKKSVSRVPVRQFDIHGEHRRATLDRSDFTPAPGNRGGHCADPQVAQGRACPVDEDCELCTNYRVDVSERRAVSHRQDRLRVQRERMILLDVPPIKVACAQARIDHCQIILDAIDDFLDGLDEPTRAEYERLDAEMDRMEDGFRVHTIDLAHMIKELNQ